MRVMTLNVNGIRSSTSKGLVPWLAARSAEIYRQQCCSDHAPLTLEYVL
jgi:exonuclease III